MERKQGLARRPEVMAFYGVNSPTSFYRKIEAGTIPRPKRLGPNTVAWKWSELYDSIEDLPTATGRSK